MSTKEKFKEFYKSKTLWINGLSLICSLILWGIGQYQAGVPLTALSIINFVNRYYTEKKIKPIVKK